VWLRIIVAIGTLGELPTTAVDHPDWLFEPNTGAG
jgi:hypothetical protein